MRPFRVPCRAGRRGGVRWKEKHRRSAYRSGGSTLSAHHRLEEGGGEGMSLIIETIGVLRGTYHGDMEICNPYCIPHIPYSTNQSQNGSFVALSSASSRTCALTGSFSFFLPRTRSRERTVPQGYVRFRRCLLPLASSTSSSSFIARGLGRPAFVHSTGPMIA